MLTRIDFSKLTLMDALDLAHLIEVEAYQRYTTFAIQLGRRDVGDAGSVFRSMAETRRNMATSSPDAARHTLATPLQE